jgi:hypothetical protein
MAYTKASDLSDGQIAMVGQARFTIEQENVLPGLFSSYTLAQGEKSIFIPKFGQVEAKDLTDGVDMTEAQQLTIGGTTHTTDEAGCKVIVTRKLREQLKAPVFDAAGKVIGNAMKKKIEQDGLSLFSGLSNGVGSGTTTCSIAYVQAAVTQLYGQSEPAPEPIHCVLHPYQYHDIKTALVTNGMADVVQVAALKNKWRGNEPLYGIPIYIAGNIDASTVSTTYGAVFSKMAFMYVVGWEPDTWMEEDGSLRGWEIGIVADYACVEEDDGYGIYMLFDATAPTT